GREHRAVARRDLHPHRPGNSPPLRVCARRGGQGSCRAARHRNNRLGRSLALPNTGPRNFAPARLSEPCLVEEELPVWQLLLNGDAFAPAGTRLPRCAGSDGSVTDSPPWNLFAVWDRARPGPVGNLAMTNSATALPARRPDLLFHPGSEQGPHVVKDPRTGAYYHLGDEEFFLLTRLDGEQTGSVLSAAYEAHYGKPLSPEDLDEFVQLARLWGFLQPTGDAGIGSAPTAANGSAEPSGGGEPGRGPGQSLLYWRLRLFDPDRLLNWLAPRLRFFWTRSFFLLSAGCIL